jgi:putative monooxygenase
MAAVALGPSDHLTGQRHPYSEKFVYAVSGRTRVVSEGEEIVLEANEAVMLPKNADHRMRNETPDGGSAFLVLFLGPLAPRPDLGHVDTEPVPRPESGPPLVGAAEDERPDDEIGSGTAPLNRDRQPPVEGPFP